MKNKKRRATLYVFMLFNKLLINQPSFEGKI